MVHLNTVQCVLSFVTLASALMITSSHTSIARWIPSYYPSATDSAWATISPDSLGWCMEYRDTLTDFIEASKTRAFIVLYDGRIAFEHYGKDHGKDSLWYWASAGKSLTAFLVGIAQAKGHLKLDDPVSKFLGGSWALCDEAAIAKITIRNSLTMTSGLDDSVADRDCTDPECLKCKYEPGSYWSYHNAAYSILHDVLPKAVGRPVNGFLVREVLSGTGIAGAFVKIGFNPVMVSTARSFARFGLLIAGNGKWNSTVVLDDTNYISDMVSTSNTINPSYGYLWWLNGKSSYMVPGIPFSIPGYLVPTAPADLYAALGKDGQILMIIPSKRMIIVRMGENPRGESLFVPNHFVGEIWTNVSKFLCATSVATHSPDAYSPAHLKVLKPGRIQVDELLHDVVVYSVYDIMGNKLTGIMQEGSSISINTPGAYAIKGQDVNGNVRFASFLVAE